MKNLLTKVQNLHKAFEELSTEWQKDLDKGNALLGRMYPFITSFDDVLIDVEHWKKNVEEVVDYHSLDLTKDDLVYFKDEGVDEPFLVLGFDDDDMLVLGLRDYPQTEMDFYIEKDIVSYYVNDEEFEKAKEIILNKI